MEKSKLHSATTKGPVVDPERLSRIPRGILIQKTALMKIIFLEQVVVV
jgi:hypothetical protein